MDESHNIQAVITTAQLANVKFVHAIGGLYLWEYFTTLDYEWRVVRGRLPYRWTTLIYSIARLAALVSVILSFVTMDTTTPIKCQLWVLFPAIFLFVASVAASLLIILRTIAIWNRNKIIVTLTTIVLGISVGFHLHNIALIRYVWVSTQHACVPVKSDFSALGTVPAIIADMVLLLIILAGLLVMRYRGGGMFDLTRFLWKQGVIWLVLGFAAQVPPLVFTFAYLNNPLHTLFWIPSEIILIIAATRMHRSLVDFASGSSDAAHGSPQMSNLVFSKIKRTNTPSGPSSALDGVEVAVPMATESHPTSSTNGDDWSTINSTSEQISQIVGDLSKYSAEIKTSYAA